MASQIERERVFGNFKPSKGHRVRERRTKKSAADRREGMSENHLAFVRRGDALDRSSRRPALSTSSRGG